MTAAVQPQRCWREEREPREYSIPSCCDLVAIRTFVSVHFLSETLFSEFFFTVVLRGLLQLCVNLLSVSRLRFVFTV